MSRQKQAYRVKQTGYRNDLPYFDLLVPDRKARRLSATDKAAAIAEAAKLFPKIVAERPVVPNPRHVKEGTLRAAFNAYLASKAFDLYKPLTKSQRQSQINIVCALPAANGKRTVGDVELTHWLTHPDAPDAVRRVMASCGSKAAQANHLRKALDQMFVWLLDPDKAEAAEARLTFRISRKGTTNPCRDVAKAKPMRGSNGRIKRGYTPFTSGQVDDWLTNAKDDPAEHRVVRLLQMTGARLSDLLRLNRGMIKQTPDGKVLTYVCEKGKGSAFRSTDSVAVVPMVPELEALIAEVPAEQFCFIVSEFGRPFSCTEGLGNRIRKWRRAAGLPEGLSAHSMRKAATHWWLRHHRDLIANNFSLKTIFGWATDKELERYTADFAREEEARGMLIKLADRRKARAAQ